MNKLLNVIIQLVLVLVFAGVVLATQGKGFSDLLSDGSLGVLILCAPLCWVVVRFYRTIWFYFTLVCLVAGFVGGYLSTGLVDGSLSGYVISLFAVFVLLGAVVVCVNGKFNLLFFPVLRLPLAGWVLIALLVDFGLELFFFDQEVGLVLLQVKSGALIAGLTLGLIARIAAVSAYKRNGVGLGKVCFVGGASVAVRNPAPVAPPVEKTLKSKPRPVAAPSVPVSSPVASRTQVASSKTSVLDAKLEALCSVDTKKKGRAQVKKTEGVPAEKEEKEQSEVESSSEPVGPATTETGKIVSSVDFG